MVRYRRNLIPGGTYFFTVTLSDRRSRLLTDQIAKLRAAFRDVWRKRPFVVDAIVVLPDHLHAIFTLPHGDADFSSRWRDIKAAFTKSAACVHNRRGALAGDVPRGEITRFGGWSGES